MDPWILWSWHPLIPIPLHPWVHRSLDLWIYGSMDLHISECLDLHITIFMHCQILVSLHAQIPRSCRSADPHIFISLHPQIFGSHSQIKHPYTILSSYSFSTIILSFHTFSVLQVSYYNSFLLSFQYWTFLLHHTSKLILLYLNDTHLLALCYHSNTFWLLLLSFHYTLRSLGIRFVCYFFLVLKYIFSTISLVFSYHTF